MFNKCVRSYTVKSAYSGRAANALAKRVATRIKKSKIRFAAIAFRGMSGGLIAPLVAAQLNKKLIVVRKRGEQSHAQYHVEGYIDSKTYIIIDDLVDTGDTCRDIMDELCTAQCKGIFLYQHDWDNTDITHIEGVKIFRL